MIEPFAWSLACVICLQDEHSEGSGWDRGLSTGKVNRGNLPRNNDSVTVAQGREMWQVQPHSVLESLAVCWRTPLAIQTWSDHRGPGDRWRSCFLPHVPGDARLEPGDVIRFYSTGRSTWSRPETELRNAKEGSGCCHSRALSKEGWFQPVWFSKRRAGCYMYQGVLSPGD